ncbi:Tll0287-like domain-containing protein [Spartinivicinus ruber]|uniref:Tll0287-like domain-containing protein n=1 Tax=Spartinivicinus ruber TaxID=2683272 RepID=UPI0013D1731E|nr:DUF3365 domain-containing protein [Spartinivicinus ruber]
MGKLDRNELTNHILVWFFVLILAFGGCFYLINDAVYISNLRSQASGIADMVTHVGHWAGKFKGGVWVKSGVREHFNPQDYLEKKTYVTELTQENKKRVIIEHYHLKNPSLVQRELSDITLGSSSKVKFRITSDNFLNPRNAPNGFEQQAIKLIKEKFHKSEYYTKSNNQFFYAREIVADRSCLNCHGDPKKAPEKLQELYPGESGYNYEQGRLAGIVSITLPYESGLLNVIKNTNIYSLLAIGLFFILIICFIAYIFIFIITPIKQLTFQASKAIQYSYQDREADTNFFAKDYKSSIEINELNKQLRSLYSIIQELKKLIKMHD